MAGTMKDVVLDILSESRLNRISFSILPVVAIGSQTFRQVREAIKGGKIQVLSKDMPQGDALFSSDEKTIFINTQSMGAMTGGSFGSATRAVILHECVHAYHFLTKPELALGDDEAAAYLTQCLYWLLTEANRHRQWTEQNKNSKDGKIFASAIQIIDDNGILFGHKRSFYRQEIKPLYQALANHPLYSGSVTAPL